MSLDGNTQYLELDFYRSSYKSVKTKQYDKDTRYIRVTCVNDATIYKLDASTMECNLKMITPDGRAMLKPQTIQTDGTVLIKLEDSMLLASGICKAELNVLEQSSKKLLSTMNFDLIVIGSVYSNDIITASDEFDALTEALLKIDDAHDLSEKIQEAENTRIDNEIIRNTNELARIKEESSRQDSEKIREESELSRNENEIARSASENERANAELERLSAENTRIVNEDIRVNEEEVRKNNETLRNTSEQSRALSELDREDSEAIRKSAENTRIIEEKKRLEAESARIESEKLRKNNFITLESGMKSAISMAEKINISTVDNENLYQIKITDKNGNTNTSPNLLNKISIGTVETGDAEESPTATITGDFGNQKLNLRLPTGKPFKISSTFISVADMEKNKDTLDLYSFVIIYGSVENEDTGKLYMKDTDDMVFITDLSGAQGIQGVKGETGETPNLTIGSVITGAEGTTASVTITGTRENPKLNLVIPKGDTGKIENMYAGNLPYESSSDTKTIKDIVDNKLNKTDNAASATKATQDINGNPIDGYIYGLSVSGKVITITRGNGTTDTILTQDTNTTYDVGTASILGLTKLYTGTGNATDGTITQKAITGGFNTVSANLSVHKTSDDHDGRYYTETETNALLNLKQNANTAINTGNIGNQSVSHANTADSAQEAGFAYGARVASSADYVNWNSVGDKPSSYPPSSHGHNNYLPNSGGVLAGELISTTGIISGSQSSYNHRIAMGVNGRDYYSFYEYGGVWNFIKHQNGKDFFNYYLNEWGWNVPGIYWSGTLNLKGSSYLNLCSGGIQCRNYNDTGWAGISASGFHTQSSRRYKENIFPMTPERAKKILDIEVVTFDYKDGIVDADRYDRTGVIVEDAVCIIPEAISYRTINGENVPDGADYSKYVPYLIKMVQSLQIELDELKSEKSK